LAEKIAQPLGTLSAALAQAGRLLARSPAKAEEQAREILNVVANQPDALLLLASARYEQGDVAGAVAALKRAVKFHPGHARAWRALGDQYTLMGHTGAADDAYARHIKASVNDPRLIEAATALCDNRLAVAERILRPFLMEYPTDVAAIRMLAETGARLGRYEDAEKLLARCVELAPGFDAARFNYATVLHRQNKTLEALAQVDILRARDAKNPGYRNLQAAALARLGETGRATAAYAQVLKDYPKQPKAWMSYGHTLKAAGRQDECIAAYRKSIALLPSLGEAYWSLANLKTFRFRADEIAAMESQLARGDLDDEDRFHLDFALAKALEDAADYEKSFGHYAKANALRRKSLDYDANELADSVARTKALFTRQFLDARRGAGSAAPDPIFIVGLPRSGSTLIEQILSSHSQIEGTAELPDIMAIARRIGGRKKKNDATAYPEALAALGAADLRTLGEDYLQRTRVQRRLGRPFFVDKMPNNFLHAGLIHLILPNAKIVDARRHPLACCLSNFKQHFARGQAFTYGLDDIAAYYAGYVEAMAHFDLVLPGRIHRVIYEEMVADPETQVRRLLDYCGVPFEESCLLFYQNDRAVRTASSEQVRMPIFADAVGHWQNYEPWLGPLKDALGPIVACYPQAPVLQEAQSETSFS
jgi:tetratricopeptide (TPR) repeat protein